MLVVEEVSFRVRLVLKFILKAGVAPEQFQCDFLLVGFRIMGDLKWSLDKLDFVDCMDSCTNSSMHAENTVFNECSQREVLEHFVDPIIGLNKNKTLRR